MFQSVHHVSFEKISALSVILVFIFYLRKVIADLIGDLRQLSAITSDLIGDDL